MILMTINGVSFAADDGSAYCYKTYSRVFYEFTEFVATGGKKPETADAHARAVLPHENRR